MLQPKEPNPPCRGRRHTQRRRNHASPSRSLGRTSRRDRATHAPTYAHDADADAIDVPTRHRLHDEKSITVGDVTLGVIHLVGHNPGSLVLTFNDPQGHTPGSLVLTFNDPQGHTHLFTGDCLFPGGVGRTWSPEDFETLYRGVVEKIFDRYDDDTWIYPGHGDDTTLGRERPSLDEWWERGW